MTLFVVRHQHQAERCPAGDPYMGAMLLHHLSRPNVRQHGIEIRSEAVVYGQHTLYMIVEAGDEATVRAFLEPFTHAGSVEVHAASTCVRVVASGGCGAVLPAPTDGSPMVDPEEACQRAIDAGLVVHRAHPLNGETSIPDLVGGVVMPNAHFYVRNHFQIPTLDPTTWRLRIGGLVERPLSLSLRELRNMPAQSLVVTLECAGNGRSLLDPPVEGEQWALGAVSTAEWTGVPLTEVLDRVGVRAPVKELVFRGGDGNEPSSSVRESRFERSLGLDDARLSEALLAYAMNGEPLPLQHGFPLRLLVPGWYAVASVKWLTEIEAIDRAFQGHFQVEKYVYESEREGELTREPVTLQRVRALITEPRPNAQIERGDLVVRGVAWSGAAPIARVDVYVGDAWQEARLTGERSRYSWQWWELHTRVDAPGMIELRARATDLADHTQPEQPEWNRLGYGNNAIERVSVRVR
jgi:DMSO/TMAO reductase YedYZ molybdopterin-dependent catalytic subunit